MQRVFAADFDRSIFSVPLAERRRRLLAIDWVEDASVSRIWPDRLLIRIRERKPVAFVSLPIRSAADRRPWRALDQPAQAQFTFPVLSGVREERNRSRRAERVRAFLQVQEDMGYLAKDISEVDASDPDNIRIVAQVDKPRDDLILGDGNFARDIKISSITYPEIRKGSPAGEGFRSAVG